MFDGNTSDTYNCSCTESVVDYWAKYVLEEVSIPLVGSIGLVGNIAAAIVLKRPDMKSTFHQSLLTLAVLDIMFLSIIICDHSLDFNSQLYVYMFPYIFNPMKNILMTWETFLIMSIATERFLAVYKPIHYRGHRVRQSSGVHMMTFILPSMVLSILLNIPKFFETELVLRHFTDENNNTYSVMDFDITSLRLDPDYIYYYVHWTRLLGTGVIPFLFLSSMNLLIYVYVRKKRPFSSRPSQHNLLSHHKRLSSVSSIETRKYSIIPNIKRLDSLLPTELRKPSLFTSYSKTMLIDLKRNSDNDLERRTNFPGNTSHSAGTLTAIVLMYLICNVPRLVLNMAEYLLYPDVYYSDSCGCSLTPTWFAILCRISHFLLTVNSSLNFLIYFSIGKRFKKIVCGHVKMFAGRVKEFLCSRNTIEKNTNHSIVNFISRNEEEYLLLIYSRKFESHRTSLSLSQIECILRNDKNVRKCSLPAARAEMSIQE